MDLAAPGEVARVKRELLMAADQNQLEPHEQLWLWCTAEAFVLIARYRAEAADAAARLPTLQRSDRSALVSVCRRRLRSLEGEQDWFGHQRLSPHRIVCRGLGLSDDSIQRLEEEARRELLLAHRAWTALLTVLSEGSSCTKVVRGGASA